MGFEVGLSDMRNFFDWKHKLFGDLTNLPVDCQLSFRVEKWAWAIDQSGMFSVKSLYEKLSKKVPTQKFFKCEIEKRFERKLG